MGSPAPSEFPTLAEDPRARAAEETPAATPVVAVFEGDGAADDSRRAARGLGRRVVSGRRSCSEAGSRRGDARGPRRAALARERGDVLLVSARHGRLAGGWSVDSRRRSRPTRRARRSRVDGRSRPLRRVCRRRRSTCRWRCRARPARRPAARDRRGRPRRVLRERSPSQERGRRSSSSVLAPARASRLRPSRLRRERSRLIDDAPPARAAHASTSRRRADPRRRELSRPSRSRGRRCRPSRSSARSCARAPTRRAPSRRDPPHGGARRSTSSVRADPARRARARSGGPTSSTGCAVLLPPRARRPARDRRAVRAHPPGHDLGPDTARTTSATRGATTGAPPPRRSRSPTTSASSRSTRRATRRATAGSSSTARRSSRSASTISPDRDVADARARPLGGRPYLLMVGSSFRHKNRVFSLRLLDGSSTEAGTEVSCSSGGERDGVVGARRGASFARPSIRSLDGRVRWLGHVGDDEQLALYRDAELVLFPSLYEGFGFIPFEAAALGTASRLHAAAPRWASSSRPTARLPSFDARRGRGVRAAAPRGARRAGAHRRGDRGARGDPDLGPHGGGVSRGLRARPRAAAAAVGRRCCARHASWPTEPYRPIARPSCSTSTGGAPRTRRVVDATSVQRRPRGCGRSGVRSVRRAR